MRFVRGVAAIWVVLVLAACSSPSGQRAPVEDRISPVTPQGAAAVPRKPAVPTVATLAAPSTAAAPGGTASNAPVESPPRALPGAENAGKPGYYTVKPGDTLIRIGLESGQSYRDIARWNALENPNRIEVGQVLRVVPPASAQAAARPAAPVVTPVAGSQVAAAPLGRASAPVAAAAAPSTPTSPDDDITWMWPANGPVIAGFDEQKNKGVDLAGSAGDPVLAAADGRVVYVGAGLRGYGNLIILKHNNTYLTAYAHNQTLLIKEDQTVRRGQKIAEMGSSDADRVKLHFEVRRQGKPIDPMKTLPPR